MRARRRASEVLVFRQELARDLAESRQSAPRDFARTATVDAKIGMRVEVALDCSVLKEVYLF